MVGKMRPMLQLAHIHLPGVTPFTRASSVQEALVSRLIAQRSPHKTTYGNDSFVGRSVRDPILLTFTPNPVYTTGRRDRPNRPSPSPSTESNSDHSNNKNNINYGDDDDDDLPEPLQPIRHLLTSTPPVAEYQQTLRGGQTTYHGPGQLVAYTIVDMHWMKLGVRDHVQLLERSVIDVLHGYGVRGICMKDPGVWVERPRPRAPGSGSGLAEVTTTSGGGDDDLSSSPRKIAALGVHCRKFVTSHGIGLNVTEEPMWYFRQIVPCGLEGREATSLEGQGVRDVSVEGVADQFAQAFAVRFNNDFGWPTRPAGRTISGVYKVSGKDVLRSMGGPGKR